MLGRFGRAVPPCYSGGQATLSCKLHLLQMPARPRPSPQLCRAELPETSPEQPEEEPEWKRAAVTKYDALVSQMFAESKAQREEIQKIKEHAEELEQFGAPKWSTTFIVKGTAVLERLAQGVQSSAEKLEAERPKFVEGLRKGEAPGPEGSAPPQLDAWDAAQWEAAQDGGTLAAAAVVQAVLLASVLTWGASWAGITPAHPLELPTDLSAVTSAALWTLPYAGATVAAGLLAPSASARRVLRIAADAKPRFFRELGAGSLLVLSLGLSYSQCLVWQGLWLEALTEYFRGGPPPAPLDGPEYLLDGGISASMGSLTAAIRLPSLLVAPLAAAGVGVAEAGWWALLQKGSDALRVALGPDQDDEGPMWPSKYAWEEGASPLTDTELWLSAVRIGISGTYLAAETLVTNSLVAPIATSTVGILVAMAMAGRQRQLDDGDANGGSTDLP